MALILQARCQYSSACPASNDQLGFNMASTVSPYDEIADITVGVRAVL